LLASAAFRWFHPRVQRIIVITGTDTGVGKTVLTALLAAHLVRKGAKVAAFKPICSGGRDDARQLRRALGNSLPLNTINPWHFRAPIAPLLAARMEKRVVRLPEVLAHIRQVSLAPPRPDYVLIEGAGGLLSPLGEGFSTRELMVELKAHPIIVGPNRLGVVNHVSLTLNALPSSMARTARIALISERTRDLASRTNAPLLVEFHDPARVIILPHFPKPGAIDLMLADRRTRMALEQLLG